MSNDGVEEYNELLNKLIIQARNDFNQFYEIKEGDVDGQERIKSNRLKLSRASIKMVDDINRVTTDLFNRVYYAVLESECLCGQPHYHHFIKFGATLNGSNLDLRIHYLLEPFTRFSLDWKILNKISNTIPSYLIVHVPMV